MPLYLFYTMVQKSQKRPKTQIKGGGSCLNKFSPFLINAYKAAKLKHAVGVPWSISLVFVSLSLICDHDSCGDPEWAEELVTLPAHRFTGAELVM